MDVQERTQRNHAGGLLDDSMLLEVSVRLRTRLASIQYRA